MSRLGLRIGVYFACVFVPTGVGISFFPVWLRERGLSVATLGALAAAGYVSKVVVNPLAAYGASRYGWRSRILVGLTAVALVASSVYLTSSSASVLAAAFLTLGILSSPIMPLGDSLMLSKIREHHLSFGGLRALGSLAVLCTILLTGALFEAGLQHAAIAVIPLSYAALLWVFIEVKAPPPAPMERQLVSAPRASGFWAFVFSSAPLQAVHGLFYTYSTMYWLDAGQSALQVSGLWLVGIASEVLVFSLAGKLRGRVESSVLLIVAAAAGIARWSLLGASSSFAWALVGQLSQGLTLAMLQAGVAAYYAERVSDAQMPRATATYSAFAYGALQAVAVALGGQLFSRWGGGAVFRFAAAVSACCLAAMVLRRWLQVPRRAVEARRASEA